jgi:hypothetical protein
MCWFIIIVEETSLNEKHSLLLSFPLQASLVATSGSPMGIGTDIGGSIRMPAFYCGVFGHKPTAGSSSSLCLPGVHAILYESVINWIKK